MITASAVKELRDKTGAGMMDCKKALEANDGNTEKAVDWLRQKGLSKAAKRAGRATTEGLIGLRIAADGKRAVAVEVKCETDFVSRGDKFQEFVKEVTDVVDATFPATQEALLDLPANGGTVRDLLTNAIATIGENMQIGRAVEMTAQNGTVGSYLHSNGKLVAFVELAASVVDDTVKAVAKDIAMQIAASNPLALDRSSLDPEKIEREREVYRQKAREDGKPEQIIEKIAEGAVAKYCKEVCLIDQAFIRDEKQSIRDLLKAASKACGAEVSIVRYARLQLGVE